MSRGMVPIMPDISPQDGFLQKDWLVPAHFQASITTRPTINIFEVSPQDLADRIDYYARLSEFTFSHWSLEVDKMSRDLSWEYLLPLYRSAIDGEELPYA
jgi:hypothetical protein